MEDLPEEQREYIAAELYPSLKQAILHVSIILPVILLFFYHNTR